jgi:hypothetical protein
MLDAKEAILWNACASNPSGSVRGRPTALVLTTGASSRADCGLVEPIVASASVMLMRV